MARKPQPPEDFQGVIDHWPSVREFAERMEVSPNTAAGWYRRNSIPSDYWADLLEASTEQSIRLAADDLVRMAARAA